VLLWTDLNSSWWWSWRKYCTSSTLL